MLFVGTTTAGGISTTSLPITTTETTTTVETTTPRNITLLYIKIQFLITVDITCFTKKLYYYQKFFAVDIYTIYYLHR